MKQSSKWVYKPENYIYNTIPLSKVFGESQRTLSHPVYQALSKLDNHPTGNKLLSISELKGTHIALDNTLNAYARVIPASQTPTETPMIIFSGLGDEWHNDLGVFVGAHELAHIIQMEENLLHNFDSDGIQYIDPNQNESTDEIMNKTILCERMADIVGTWGALESETSSIKRLLSSWEETAPLTSYLMKYFSADTKGCNDLSTELEHLIDLDTFTDEEMRYYLRYGETAPQPLSPIFNTSALAHEKISAYKQAQCQLATRILCVK